MYGSHVIIMMHGPWTSILMEADGYTLPVFHLDIRSGPSRSIFHQSMMLEYALMYSTTFTTNRPYGAEIFLCIPINGGSALLILLILLTST